MTAQKINVNTHEQSQSKITV